MKYRPFLRLPYLLLSVCLLCGCAAGSGRDTDELSSQPTEEEPLFGPLGSAGAMRGVTLIVSVFTDDSGTHWDFQSEEDSATVEDTLDNLRISTEYLERQASAYGQSASFLWDWRTYGDLRYEAAFEENLVTESGEWYEAQCAWLKEHIDTDALRKKYEADNVVYFFFLNTGYDNQVNPWSMPFHDFEYANIFVKFDDCFITPPASYAHEIMHCFGAHDLYYENDCIPQDYVDYCAETGSNDIMFTVSGGKEITNEFTDLDAYYVGLTDACEEVTRWDLAPSEHLTLSYGGAAKG